MAPYSHYLPNRHQVLLNYENQFIILYPKQRYNMCKPVLVCKTNCRYLQKNPLNMLTHFWCYRHVSTMIDISNSSTSYWHTKSKLRWSRIHSLPSLNLSVRPIIQSVSIPSTIVAPRAVPPPNIPAEWPNNTGVCVKQRTCSTLQDFWVP